MPDDRADRPKNAWPSAAWKQCHLCGGGEYGGGPASPNHHRLCPFRWHAPQQPTVVLRLNPYQAANLLRVLKEMWIGKLPVPNGGDWCGEIPQQLEAMMRAMGGPFTNYTANDGTLPLLDDPRTDV